MCSYYYFSCHYQIALKIKPLYLTYHTSYLTSNTTRVVQQQQIFIMISTKYFYKAELGQIPVFTAHYGESPYKTCLYGEFLNLYDGGQANSIFGTGINVARRH